MVVGRIVDTALIGGCDGRWLGDTRRERKGVESFQTPHSLRGGGEGFDRKGEARLDDSFERM